MDFVEGMIPKKPGIYKITNKVNGKIYIGKSNNLYRRIQQHRREEIRPLRFPQPITRAIKKYGWSSFEITILDSFSEITNIDLLNKEADYINQYKATDRNIGYNVAIFSNDCTGIIRSNQTRKIMSDIMLKKYNNPNNKHPWLGRHHSIETKRKISQSHKQWHQTHTISEEKRIKLKNAALKCDRNKLKKPIAQINILTDEIIKIWPSLTEATVYFHRSSKRCSNIWLACNNYHKPSNDLTKQHKRRSAFGYYWEYVI